MSLSLFGLFVLDQNGDIVFVWLFASLKEKMLNVAAKQSSSGLVT